MGAAEGNAAVDWLLEAMADDRAEAAVHATPEMTAMAPAHLPDGHVPSGLGRAGGGADS